MAENNPKKHKKLGRQVKGFDSEIWDDYNQDIVEMGNWLKFTQNKALHQKLINSGDKLLIEGSPLDKIWGVGMRFDHASIGNVNKHKGLNLLGNCLMSVRQMIVDNI